MKTRLTLAALALFTAAIGADAFAAETPRKPKALMIMVDGLRADAVENAPMTNLLRLRDGKWQKAYRGFSSLTGHTLYDARPSSAANHAAIATGVTAAKTRIFKNGDTPHGDFQHWPSWLARLVEAQPDKKALYTYSWTGDTRLSPHPNVRNMPLTTVVTNNWPVGGSYEQNATAIPKLMAAPDAPDAVLYFIDIGDWGGHRSGFYPYGGEYVHDMRLADRIIGDTLAAIASRPGFKDEDWLVMVTSDHGGYGRKHGIWGGHATTIPVIIAGCRVPQGTIAGMPRNYDLAPIALAHFGIDTAPMNLDGVAPTVAADIPVRTLKDGLAAYLTFDGAPPANVIAGGPSPNVHGATKAGARSGMFGNCLRVAPDKTGACGVSLDGSEKLAFENGTEFAFSFWMRLDDPQQPQAPIVANKDWASGKNAGIVLIAARKTDSVTVSGVCFNCGMTGKAQRIDMGTFDIDYGEWCFYAVTRRADGVLRVYQGGRDGRLYWIAEDAREIKFKTGLPFWIGQDGTGACKVSLTGDIDDFALWTRAASHADIRRIYEAGRRGQSLEDLLPGEPGASEQSGSSGTSGRSQ
ncbi:MAG: alkaline phosphatase family protein [Kiritimatiellae bacterium]|nr:alkaline phosphatase family protein [Kiritimatiellia bacterium]